MSETRSIELTLEPAEREANVLWRITRGPLVSLAVIAAVIVAWEVCARAFQIPDFILPAPSKVWRDTAEIGWDLVGHAEATLGTILAGYAIAFALSLPFAIALSSSRLLSAALYPLLIIKQSVPVVALAPILIVILGAGAAPRITITVLIALFPMVVSTATGLANTPKEFVELSQALGATRWRCLVDLRLPAAVPYIFSGAKISMTLSVVGAVVGEFVAAERGLGYLIYTSTAYFHVSVAFGAMIVLSCFGLVLFQSVSLIERWFFPWAATENVYGN